MYEQPVKVSGKKLIEICILIALIIWGAFLLINYKRYCDSKKPILMFYRRIPYDDGYTDNYTGLFYNIRYYRRNSITKDEMVPFWVFMQNPEATPDLPVPEKGYKVPDNNRRLDKYMGLLYYYDSNRDLIGTYKCLNGTSTCDKAVSGWDSYDIIGNNPFTSDKKYYTFKLIHDKYAFIDDSYEQSAKYGDPTYNRIVYLYKVDKKEPEILAKYSDIKESTFDEDKELADGYKNQFIVKSMDNNKWGLISISEAGTITEVLPFEYDSINFDKDTYFYILCKDGVWSVKDLDRDQMIIENIQSVIYDVWKNSNQTYYYIIGNTDKLDGQDTIMFKAYRANGTPMLDIRGVTAIYPFARCIMYVDSADNKLKFMDYGREVRVEKQLYFSLMKHDDFIHPAVSIYTVDSTRVSLRIYQSRNQTNEYDTDSVNIFDLTKN